MLNKITTGRSNTAHKVFGITSLPSERMNELIHGDFNQAYI